MEPYKNLSGRSGVVGFCCGEDYIIVQFRNGEYTFYRYEGKCVEHLIQLARSGRGLNAELARKGHPSYTKRGCSLSEVL